MSAFPAHSTRKPPTWQEAGGALALFAVFSTMLFWPQVGQGKALYWGDIGLYFSPLAHFLHSELRHGRLPLWNPYTLCGTPFSGNPQTATFYPATLLLSFNTPTQWINLCTAGHTAWAAWGTWLFLRGGLNRTFWAAVLGGAVFGFGGELVSKEQFPNMLEATAWLPFCLLGVKILMQSTHRANALRAGIVLGTVFGLQLLAAHAQISLLTFYLCAAYGLAKRNGRRVWIWGACAALILACGLSAVQVLPDAAALHDAWRQKLSFDIVNRFYLPWNQLGNWMLPRLHGHPADGDFTGRGNFWETCCYVGVLPCMLAVVGVLSSRREREMRFWLGTFIVGAWLATGGAGGLYHLAYWIVPGVRSFHDPARCLVVAAFALSVLAARGLDAVRLLLGHKATARSICAVFVGLAFADLAHFDRQMYPLAPPHLLNPILPPVAAVLSDPDIQSQQARTVAPDTARIWQRFTGHRAYRGDESGYLALWADTLTPNLPLGYGLRDAWGYEPVARRDASAVTGTAIEKLRENALSSVWAGMLGVKYVALCRVHIPTVSTLSVVRADPTLPPLGKHNDAARSILCISSDFQPRARITTDFVTCPTRAVAWNLLSQASRQPGVCDLTRTTVVVGPVRFTPRRADASQPALITEDLPDTVTVTADCAQPSLLVLADTLAPGWTATLDERPTPILSADGMLRAVALPRAGRHVVTFSYRPTPFALGLYVSLLSIAVLVGWGTAKIMWAIMKTGKENAASVSNSAPSFASPTPPSSPFSQ